MLELELVEETVFIDPKMVCGYSITESGELNQVMLKWGSWQTVTNSEHNRKVLRKKFPKGKEL